MFLRTVAISDWLGTGPVAVGALSAIKGDRECIRTLSKDCAKRTRLSLGVHTESRHHPFARFPSTPTHCRPWIAHILISNSLHIPVQGCSIRALHAMATNAFDQTRVPHQSRPLAHKTKQSAFRCNVGFTIPRSFNEPTFRQGVIDTQVDLIRGGLSAASRVSMSSRATPTSIRRPDQGHYTRTEPVIPGGK
jgi:hypothetical protein